MSCEERSGELAAANAAFVDEDYDSALQHYSAALRLSPNDPDVLLRRSACYFALGQYLEALEDCRSCLRAEPTNAKALFRKGRTLFALKEFESAHNSFLQGRSLPKDINSVSARNWNSWIGKCELEMGADGDNSDSSAQGSSAPTLTAPDLTDASVSSSSFSEISEVCSVVSASASSSRVIPLPTVLDEMGDDHGPTEDELEEDDDEDEDEDDDEGGDIGSLSPLIPHAGGSPAAQSDLKRGSPETPSSDAPPPQQQCKTTEGQAVSSTSSSSSSAAATATDGLTPAQKEAAQHKSEGNRMFSQRKYAAALMHYNKAVECDPNNHLLYTNKAVAHHMLGDFAEALASAKRSIELEPTWAKGYFRAGEAELELNHFEEARSYFAKTLELDGTLSSAQSGLAIIDCFVRARTSIGMERLSVLRKKFTVKQLFAIVRTGLTMMASEEFARACTAVTQNMEENRIRCVRHVYIDRYGTLRSHGSSLTDEHVQRMLREDKVQPIYMFVIVNTTPTAESEIPRQTYMWRPPPEETAGGEMELSEIQSTILDLLVLELNAQSNFNEHIRRILKY